MIIITYIKLLFLSLIQNTLIFRPRRRNIENIKEPESYGFGNIEEFFLEHINGEKICLWKNFESLERKTFIFFHGNTGNIADVGKPEEGENYDRRYRLKLLEEIKSKGQNFIAVSLRGYGKSDGYPSEKNFEEDLKLIANYIVKQGLKNIVVIGESLGSNSALKLNELIIKRDIKLEKVILIAPFSNLINAVEKNYPEFKKVNLSKWLRHRLDNLEILSNSNSAAKFVLFHSNDDETTDISHSKMLLEAGKSNNLDIKLVELEKAGHINWKAEQIISEALK